MEYWFLEQRMASVCDVICASLFFVLLAAYMHAASCERAPTRLSAVFCVRNLMDTLMCNQC